MKPNKHKKSRKPTDRYWSLYRGPGWTDPQSCHDNCKKKKKNSVVLISGPVLPVPSPQRLTLTKLTLSHCALKVVADPLPANTWRRGMWLPDCCPIKSRARCLEAELSDRCTKWDVPPGTGTRFQISHSPCGIWNPDDDDDDDDVRYSGAVCLLHASL